MARLRMAQKNIDQYGKTVKIQNSSVSNEPKFTKAFIQPLRSVNRSYQWNNYLDPGYADLSSYIYIGSPDVRLDTYPTNGTVVQDESQGYIIKKADAVYIKDEVIYIWAILQKYIPEEN